MTPEELIAFEEDVAAEFNAGKIKAPVHLYSGGEREMIDIFRDIRSQDWVLCSWRSHYQCLLKGVPPVELKAKIMQGCSIALSFPEYRILSSAIIGGVLPIAVGLGMAVKRKGEDIKVHVFVGDMTSETGVYHECLKYVENFDLPVFFHVEDNNLSVCTDTRKAWGCGISWAGNWEGEDIGAQHSAIFSDHVTYFRYEAKKYPHAGAGKRVQF
jgi:pyruvate dehydrogenase E1 component alpha subunit